MKTLDMTLPLQKFCLILRQTFLSKGKITEEQFLCEARIEIFVTFLIKEVLYLSFARTNIHNILPDAIVLLVPCL